MKVGFWNFYQVFSFICLHASFLTDSFNKTLILKWDVNNKDINETLWQVAIGIEPVIVVDIRVCGNFLYGDLDWICGGQFVEYCQKIQEGPSYIESTEIESKLSRLHVKKVLCLKTL